MSDIVLYFAVTGALGALFTVRVAVIGARRLFPSVDDALVYFGLARRSVPREPRPPRPPRRPAAPPRPRQEFWLTTEWTAVDLPTRREL